VAHSRPSHTVGHARRAGGRTGVGRSVPHRGLHLDGRRLCSPGPPIVRLRR